MPNCLPYPDPSGPSTHQPESDHRWPGVPGVPGSRGRQAAIPSTSTTKPTSSMSASLSGHQDPNVYSTIMDLELTYIPVSANPFVTTISQYLLT